MDEVIIDVGAKAANKLGVTRQYLIKIVTGKNAYHLAQTRLNHADLTRGLKKVKAA